MGGGVTARENKEKRIKEEVKQNVKNNTSRNQTNLRKYGGSGMGIVGSRSGS